MDPCLPELTTGRMNAPVDRWKEKSGKLCMQEEEQSYLRRDIAAALGTASTLINQDGSRVGMLAITRCERAV